MFTKASTISSWVWAFNLTDTSVFGSPRAQMMGEGLTLSSNPLVHAFQSQFSTSGATYTSTVRCQQGVTVSRLLSLQGMRVQPGALAKTARDLEDPVRLSSKHPGISLDVSGLQVYHVAGERCRRVLGSVPAGRG